MPFTRLSSSKLSARCSWKPRTHANRRLVFPIRSFLTALPPIKIVDIGAMSLGEGEDPYSPLLAALPCELIGFEPVEAEFAKLQQTKSPNTRFLPFFIGDGSIRTFHECNASMTSSLFEPNTALLEKFQNLEELVRVVRTEQVQTKRLDDIPEVSGTDFLKVDVQGAEMLVFQGGVNMLKDVLVIHTEVEFVELYKGQCLFSDVDPFLRGLGFQLHKLTQAGRAIKPLIVNGDVNAPMSQLLWGDAIYVRNFMAFSELEPPALLKLAAILHENYHSFDLAALALEAHDQRLGTQLQPAYIERLTS